MSYTAMAAAAYAAVIAAKLRSVVVAVAVGLAMGIAGAMVQKYLPSGSEFTAAVIPSIPFAFALVFLIFNLVRSGRINEAHGVGGALDRAIAPSGGHSSERPADSWAPGFGSRLRLPAVAAIAVAATLSLSNFWIGLVGGGIAFGVAFLGMTLVTGEGGMVWLCQITFAGIGAISTAQLATVHGWNVFLAVVGGGAVAMPFGVLIGLLTIRMGDLYVALVTLTFGILADRLIFQIHRFYNFGQGVPIDRPSFAETNMGFTYLMIAIFCVVAIVLTVLRRSSIGLALRAIRSSEVGARTIGVPVVRVKMLITGMSAMIAGIGGGCLALYARGAIPDAYFTFIGLVWLAVLVPMGLRSNIAAAMAGLAYVLVPALFLVHLSPRWSYLPPAMFGLSAIMVAKHPDGMLAMHAQNLRRLAEKLHARRDADGNPSPPPAGSAKAGAGSDFGKATIS